MDIKIIICVLMSFTCSALAAIRVAANAQADTIQELHDSSDVLDGDTIMVPPGGALWSVDGVKISKNITLDMTGVCVTNIAPTSSPRTKGRTIWFTPLDDSYRQRLTGVTTTDYAWTGSKKRYGQIAVNGAIANFRMDHCRITNRFDTGFRTGGYVRGVMDHNYFFHYENAFELYSGQWAGGVWADSSWSEPFFRGADDTTGQNNFYIESNFFQGDTSSGNQVKPTSDTYAGARFVYRDNTNLNSNIATHGTGDGSGRDRGPSWAEYYANSFTADPPNSKISIHIRHGSGLTFSNTIVGHTGSAIALDYYRIKFGAFGGKGHFGPCNGFNPFDVNDRSDGPATPGGAGDGIFALEVASDGSANDTLVVANAGWTPGQWNDYVLVVSNALACAEELYSSKDWDGPYGQVCPHFAAVVITNTATTITVDRHTQNPKEKPFRPGDVVAFTRVLLPLDCVGSGQCDLLTDKGTDPTPVNLNPTRRPWASWLNTQDGAPVLARSQAGVLENYHFFNERVGGFAAWSPNGGLTIGSLSQMQSVAANTNFTMFWVTNTTPQRLWAYVDGSWEQYWTPATYPHPLVSGEDIPSVPVEPSDLVATAVSSSQVTLTWTDNSDNEAGFNVERGTSAETFQPLASVSAGTTTHSDTALTAATTYYYRLRAFNDGGFSDYSNETSETTMSQVSPTPRGRKATIFKPL